MIKQSLWTQHKYKYGISTRKVEQHKNKWFIMIET